VDQEVLRRLAVDAIELSLDGERLRPTRHEVMSDARGATIRLKFRLPAAARHGSRLTVTSSVPARMSPGHRELLTVEVDGREAAETLLDAGSDSTTVVLDRSAASPGRAAWSFLLAGIHHILSGYDHLVFLAGLLLAARSLRQLLIALSAFTAAHSVSLTLVVAGGVNAPASIVEPLIAASIAWIGIENLRGERRAAPWFVVFGFGLIHGFGLAGALMDLGLGSSASRIALALLCFNAGVEAGQLAVAAALLPLVGAIKSRPAWRGRLVPACSVLIAMSGGYWLIERIAF
jgi:hydrogenase/urease accessory protein HupE